ncbi:hypothetical protein ACFSGX_06655 [Sphingomonas arantia]|uniref:DUF4349 domain-containing protein n=1 Tax=Sphingomonas arantia TaxID=1460676 RepID=A0ABW4TUT0_9SPHN
MLIRLPIMIVAMTLAGCSGGDSGGGGVAEPDAASTIAYGFDYRFALPGTAVGQAQDRHIALCDRLGPARCRMLEMHRSVGMGQGASSGSLRFAVASADTRAFDQALLAPVSALGGKLVSRDFEAEDLSVQRTEAQAKVAQKGGATNQAALANIQQRLQTSAIRIQYDGTSGFFAQVGGALGAAGETLTASVVALVYALAASLPWLLVGGILFLAIRAFARWLKRVTGGRLA